MIFKKIYSRRATGEGKTELYCFHQASKATNLRVRGAFWVKNLNWKWEIKRNKEKTKYIKIFLELPSKFYSIVDKVMYVNVFSFDIVYGL